MPRFQWLRPVTFSTIILAAAACSSAPGADDGTIEPNSSSVESTAAATPNDELPISGSDLEQTTSSPNSDLEDPFRYDGEDIEGHYESDGIMVCPVAFPLASWFESHAGAVPVEGTYTWTEDMNLDSDSDASAVRLIPGVQFCGLRGSNDAVVSISVKPSTPNEIDDLLAVDGMQGKEVSSPWGGGMAIRWRSEDDDGTQVVLAGPTVSPDRGISIQIDGIANHRQVATELMDTLMATATSKSQTQTQTQTQGDPEIQTRAQAADTNLRPTSSSGSMTKEKRNTTSSAPATDWASPAASALECSEPEADLESVDSADVSGDGAAETIIAARCPAHTSQPSMKALVFDSDDPGSATPIGVLGGDERYMAATVAINGRIITMTGHSRSPEAPNCCPDLEVTVSYELRGESFEIVDRVVTELDNANSIPATETSSSVDDRAGNGFITPSGNIQCAPLNVEGAEGVECNISETDTPVPGCDDSQPGNVWTVGATGSVEQDGPIGCRGDRVQTANADTINYGESTSINAVVCAIEESGVTCTNLDGHGFTISRAGYKIF